MYAAAAAAAAIRENHQCTSTVNINFCINFAFFIIFAETDKLRAVI